MVDEIKEQKIETEVVKTEVDPNDKKKIQVKRIAKKTDSKFDKKKKPVDREFDKRIISIRRVTRVNKGGKRMRLSVCLVIGDKKGRVGIGMGKGADVRAAEEKAYNYAKKHLITVPLYKSTIPHTLTTKQGAAKIFMKPAAPGTGVVAGSSLRAVLEVAGVKNILTKIIGTNNQINNAYAAIEGLKSLKSPKDYIRK